MGKVSKKKKMNKKDTKKPAKPSGWPPVTGKKPKGDWPAVVKKAVVKKQVPVVKHAKKKKGKKR